MAAMSLFSLLLKVSYIAAATHFSSPVFSSAHLSGEVRLIRDKQLPTEKRVAVARRFSSTSVELARNIPTPTKVVRHWRAHTNKQLRPWRRKCAATTGRSSGPREVAVFRAPPRRASPPRG
ncbi:uncharacterized protein Tco025E_08993 [Trypanosoma conorhini]|uniref:Secreted protein n=1 Tax=Trypanosoma conorhini TaxID=83891 RepID=A0A422N218_9TRYP|nr:uncharacterized protein Tco025E_08993 [Trypanosoma conorhini]RNE99500.1 hypothetical protein Tco025E_08993 [Trypanosoma conorhini]